MHTESFSARVGGKKSPNLKPSNSNSYHQFIHLVPGPVTRDGRSVEKYWQNICQFRQGTQKNIMARILSLKILIHLYSTVCPRSLAPFYIVLCNYTSLTNSKLLYTVQWKSQSVNTVFPRPAAPKLWCSKSVMIEHDVDETLINDFLQSNYENNIYTSDVISYWVTHK